jgi:O-antigen ligase
MMEGVKSIDKKAILFTVLFLAVITVFGLLFQQHFILVAALLFFISLLLIHQPRILLFILVASIPWSIEYQVSSAFATDLPDEPLMLLMCLVVILFVIFNYKEAEFKFRNILFFLLALQLLWTLITVLFSSMPVVSIKYVLAKSWYLLAFLVAPVLFLRNEKHIKQLAFVFVISMVIAAFVALVRISMLNFSFAEVNKSVSPFFRNHVNYSALLVLVIPVVFAFRSFSNSHALRVFISLIILLLVAAVYFSYARGAWLALVIGGIAYFLLKYKLLFKAYLIAIALCIAAVIYLIKDNNYLRYAHDYKTTIYHEEFKEHLVATYQLKDVSSAERFYRWIAGIRMIKDHWSTGSGPNTFYPLYKQYTVPAFRTWVSRNEEKSTVHNYFLLMLIEQGAIGLLLFLLLLGILFYKAQTIYQRTKDKFWKTCAAAIAVILSMICIVNFLSDLIETDKIGSIFYLCIAILIIADNKTRSSQLSPHMQSVS